MHNSRQHYKEHLNHNAGSDGTNSFAAIYLKTGRQPLAFTTKNDDLAAPMTLINGCGIPLTQYGNSQTLW
jgi:hypothetical protein